MGALDIYLQGIDAAVARRSPPPPASPPFQDEAADVADQAAADMGEASSAGGAALAPFSEDGSHPAPAPPAASVDGFAKPTAAPVKGEFSRVLPSELPGVGNEAWTKFVYAMKTAQPSAVSASNAFGMFEMKPKRLADLGIMRNLRCTRSAAGRMAWHGDWVPPLRQQDFLGSPRAQYRAFVGSVIDYALRIRDGRIAKPEGGHPEGMTLSGALAVLHRCGPSGLKTWNDEDNRFPETVSLYERANGIF